MESEIAVRQLEEIEKYASKKMRLAAEEWDEEWQTLIAILLSARTRDETTIEVGKKLFDKYKSVNELANTVLADVEAIVKPVNFYRNKAKSVIGCAKVLVEKFDGKVPREISKLIELPGIGRKTANVFISEMGGDAIGIDTHASYISQKMGWTKSSKPKIIEKDLENLFPKKYWSKINPILVRFGKTYIARRKQDEILEKIKSMD